MAKGKKTTSSGGLSTIIQDLGMAGIIGALVIYIIESIKLRLGSNSTTVNATFDTAREGPSEIINWLPILAVIIMSFLAISYFRQRD